MWLSSLKWPAGWDFPQNWLIEWRNRLRIAWKWRNNLYFSGSDCCGNSSSSHITAVGSLLGAANRGNISSKAGYEPKKKLRRCDELVGTRDKELRYMGTELKKNALNPGEQAAARRCRLSLLNSQTIWSASELVLEVIFIAAFIAWQAHTTPIRECLPIPASARPFSWWRGINMSNALNFILHLEY